MKHSLGFPNASSFSKSIQQQLNGYALAAGAAGVAMLALAQPGAAKIVNAGETLHVYKDEPLAKSAIDKNELAHRIVRALGDAAYRMAISPGRVGGISIPGGGGVGVGQKGPPPPPTAGPPAGSSGPSGAPPPG